LAYLIDTDVLSEPLKARPDRRVIAWLEGVEESLLYLSVLTIGEIEKGIAKLGDRPKAAKLERWLEEELTARFAGRLLPIDLEVASRWGRVCGEAERRGEKLPVIDSLIGAAALVYGLTVATRNVRDISRTGAAVFNPWE
jgi:hypothetical protein